jgi:signal transduction histidine kinase
MVSEALGHAEEAMTELRELAHGIMPTVLTRGGVLAAVTALGARAPVPVEIDVPPARLPPHVEATAYFVVAEALTNGAKHAHAARATVQASIDDDMLRVVVRDDGVGGARTRGSGVLGLADRVAVLGGRLVVESPKGGGTLVVAEIPIPAVRRAPSSGAGHRPRTLRSELIQDEVAPEGTCRCPGHRRPPGLARFARLPLLRAPLPGRRRNRAIVRGVRLGSRP